MHALAVRFDQLHMNVRAVYSSAVACIVARHLMSTVVKFLKYYLCVRRDPRARGSSQASAQDLDLEMEPLCDGPVDEPPSTADTGYPPAAHGDDADGQGGVQGPGLEVHVAGYTPVVVRAAEPRERRLLSTRLLQRVRSRMPSQANLLLGMNPDLLESQVWMLKANHPTETIGSVFEHRDVLRSWGVAQG